MKTGFSRHVEDQAWERQGGMCAGCGKPLVYYNRGQGGRGAYWPVRMKPDVYAGPSSADNCVLLCTRCQETRFGGDGESRRRAILDRKELPFLQAGMRQALDDGLHSEPQQTSTVVSKALAVGRLTLP
jgi:hypothetical protein